MNQTSSPITEKIMAKLGSTKTLDQLFEEAIHELRQEARQDPEKMLHIVSPKHPTAPALCGEEAPAGGWFNPAAKRLRRYLEFIQAPTCPSCRNKYLDLLD